MMLQDKSHLDMASIATQFHTYFKDLYNLQTEPGSLDSNPDRVKKTHAFLSKHSPDPIESAMATLLYSPLTGGEFLTA